MDESGESTDFSAGKKSKHIEGKTQVESTELGAMCLSEGEVDKAIKHFEMAIVQGGSDDPVAHMNLGGALELAGREDEAQAEYELAASLQNRSEPVLGVAQLLKQSGKYSDAILKMAEAIHREPTNAFLHYKLAEALYELKEYRKAEASAVQAVEHAPDDSFYHFWLAELRAEMGRFEEALPHYKEAIERSPGDDHYYFCAAIAFWGAGQPLQALKAIRLASDLNPDNGKYRGLLYLFLRGSDQQLEADLEKTKLKGLDPYDREHVNRAAARIGMPGLTDSDFL